MPPPPPRRRGRAGLVVGLVLGLVLVLGAGGAAAWWFVFRVADADTMLLYGREVPRPVAVTQAPSESWRWQRPEGAEIIGVEGRGGVVAVTTTTEGEDGVRTVGLSPTGEELWTVGLGSSTAASLDAPEGYLFGYDAPTAPDDPDASATLEVASTEDGSVLWSGDGALVGSTDETVLVAGDGELRGLGLDDGGDVWSTEADASVLGDGDVATTAGSQVRLVEADTGEEAWSVPNPFGEDSPVVVLSEDQVVLRGPDSMTALARDDGERLWTRERADAAAAVRGGDVVVGSTEDGTGAVHDLEGPTGAGQVRWDGLSPVISWAVGREEFLALGSSIGPDIVAADGDTGTTVPSSASVEDAGRVLPVDAGYYFAEPDGTLSFYDDMTHVGGNPDPAWTVPEGEDEVTGWVAADEVAVAVAELGLIGYR